MKDKYFITIIIVLGCFLNAQSYSKAEQKVIDAVNDYWEISAGSDKKDLAYRFIRHCASREMDRVLTLEGGNGCRRSTWQDEQLNRQIPFYRGLEALQSEARDMPRLPEWTRLANVIDAMMMEAIHSDRSVADIAEEGRREADRIPG